MSDSNGHGHDMREEGTGPAAWSALDSVQERLIEDGYDPSVAWIVVMVLMPTGRVEDATLAATLPTLENADERQKAKALFDHVLTQLGPIARELGVQIIVQNVSN